LILNFSHFRKVEVGDSCPSFLARQMLLCCQSCRTPKSDLDYFDGWI